MSQISNILFDFGNVIIDLDIADAEANIEKLLKKGTVRSDVVDLVHQFETAACTEDAFIDGILSLSKPGTRRTDVIEAWNSMLINIPRYRLTMLEQLKKRHNIYMLSNTNSLHIAWVHQYLERFHRINTFEKHFFHGVYYSHEIRARKPDPSAFQYVVEEAMITPSRTLFIDDHPDNITTAQNLGFQTHLIKPDEEVAEYLKLRGLY